MEKIQFSRLSEEELVKKLKVEEGFLKCLGGFENFKVFRSLE